MTFNLPRNEPDGSVLIMGVRYPGSTNPDKVWDYAWIRAAGLWYGSGMGRVPQAAGSGAVERWLASQDRVLVYAHRVTQTEELHVDASSVKVPSMVHRLALAADQDAADQDDMATRPAGADQ